MSDRRKALATVDALGAVLRKEIAAIESGDFSLMVQYSGEKARLGSLLETLLQADPEAVDQNDLRDLKALITRDAQSLQQARHATAEIIQEVSDIRERRSIAGLYGRSGEKRGNRATFATPVDKMV